MRAAVIPIDRTTIVGLKAQTKTSRNGCWVWQRACIPAGYAEVRVNGSSVRIQRLVWEMLYGTIPDGMVIRHKCDNPPCINPDHLIVGTQKDNIHDSIKKGRHSPPPVHKKLTDCEINEIRKLSSDMTRVSIAIQYGVTPGHVSKIILRQTRMNV